MAWLIEVVNNALVLTGLTVSWEVESFSFGVHSAVKWSWGNDVVKNWAFFLGWSWVGTGNSVVGCLGWACCHSSLTFSFIAEFISCTSNIPTFSFNTSSFIAFVTWLAFHIQAFVFADTTVAFLKFSTIGGSLAIFNLRNAFSMNTNVSTSTFSSLTDIEAG